MLGGVGRGGRFGGGHTPNLRAPVQTRPLELTCQLAVVLEAAVLRQIQFIAVNLFLRPASTPPGFGKVPSRSSSCSHAPVFVSA